VYTDGADVRVIFPFHFTGGVDVIMPIHVCIFALTDSLVL
jgi:hypothetical protein